MAVGDVTPKRLAGPSIVGITNTVILTVGASLRQNLKQVIICNTNGVDAWITVAIGTSATIGNAFFYHLPLAANDTLIFDTAITLVATETIQAISDRGAINVIITGWEESL